MENYISKFIIFLNNKCHIHEKENIYDTEKSIMYSYYKSLISYFQNDQKTTNIFVNFNIFSNLIMESNLNSIEKTNLLFYVFKRNIELGILTTNRTFINLSDILSYHFKTITNMEFLELLNNHNFHIFMSSSKDLLDEETLIIRQEIEEFINNNNNTSTIVDAHNIFLNHYINPSSLTISDIKLITKSLETLEIDERLIKIVEFILNKKYNKKIPKKTPPVTHNNNEEKLSIIEYNRLSSELNKYFDISRMRIKPYLTLNLEEIIHCVSIMFKLKINSNKINDFIRICNKQLIKISNPIILFNEIYPKLHYYKDNPEIKEAIKNIEDCLYNMIDLKYDEYYEWEDFLKNELFNLIHILPNDNEYELTYAKKNLQN